LGYGTCWIGAFTEEDVKGLLDIPKEMTVINLLPIGVPDESPGKKSRKPFEEIFHEEKYVTST
jgi:nitroreductase